MIRINEQLSIPVEALEFSFSRSSGPGGQNVNKVATKVTLSFDARGSGALSDGQRATVLRHLASRITQDGRLVVAASSERSQSANRAAAVARFVRLLQQALRPRKKRVRTKPTAASRERRLKEKAKRSEIKAGRRRFTD